MPEKGKSLNRLLKRWGIAVLLIITGMTMNAAEAEDEAAVVTPEPRAVIASEPVRTLPKKLPARLAACILHTRYVFGCGAKKESYWGNTVSVSGLVYRQEVRRLKGGNFMSAQYDGQYWIPLMGDQVVCIAPSTLSLTRLLGNSR